MGGVQRLQGSTSRRPAARAGDAALDEIVARIRACRICVEHPNRRPLPHAPRPVLRVDRRAPLAVFSQAPGIRAHDAGLPFKDPSGVRLRAWMGIDEATFYDPRLLAIAPMGFCFPGYDAKGGDLPPRRECAPAWRQELLRHLDRLELVLLVGSYAQNWHLGPLAGSNLTETVRDWRRIAAETGRSGPVAVPLPHPSWRNNGWLKANPWFEAELLQDLRARVSGIVSRRGAGS